MNSKAAREVFTFTIGGGWGKESPEEGLCEVAVIRGTDIPRVNAGQYDTVPIRFETSRKLKNRLLEEGDLILETAGGSSANGQYTGRTSLVTKEILEALGSCIPASFCKRLTIDKSVFDPKWVFYYMQDLYKSGRVAEYDSQSTGISNFQFESFLHGEILEYPTKNEQQTVSDVLSSLDDKIRLNTEMSKTLEAIAQTIFKSWFIDFDPVHAKMRGEKPEGMDDATAALFPDSFEESELGLIPKGWEVKAAGDILKRIKVKPLPSKTSVFVTGKTMVLEQGDSVVLGYIDDEASVEADIHKPRFIFGDHTCRMRIQTMPFSVTSNTIVLEGNGIDNYFAFYATNGLQQFESYRRHWMELVPRLVTVPTRLIATEFAKFVMSMHSLIDEIYKENSMISLLRDSLLPRLISGELEITDEMLTS